jgi:hypothetical protein
MKNNGIKKDIFPKISFKKEDTNEPTNPKRFLFSVKLEL